MKKSICFVLASVLAVSAFAGSISRGGGSFSPSRSISSTAPARSMGMSRPSVAPSKPQPSAPSAPSYTAPRPSTSPQYAPAPAPSVAHAAPSTGSTFLSSMGGSFVGSMIGNSLFGGHGGGGGTTVVNNGGGGGAIPAAAAGGTMVAAAPSMSPSAWLWQVLVCIMLIAIIGALVWFIIATIRAVKNKRMEDDPEALPFSAVSRFLEVQKAFAAKDVQALRTLLGPELIEQVLADLPEEATTAQLVGICYNVVDATKNIISIRFQAEDKMDGTRLDEVWHFSRMGGVWVLNGIDQ